MATLCNTQDVIDRASVGANATIIASSAIIDRFIARAEDKIVGETRRNWVSDYSSVTSGAKAVLKVCAAAFAAKEIINYDTTGFYSRQAGEIALDVNQDDYTTSLKTLKEMDANKIRSVD